MARVTVEDIIDKMPKRFELVLLAAQRARALAKGSHIVSMSTYFNGREIFLIDGLPENTSRNSVETMGSGTGKWQAR